MTLAQAVNFNLVESTKATVRDWTKRGSYSDNGKCKVVRCYLGVV